MKFEWNLFAGKKLKVRWVESELLFLYQIPGNNHDIICGDENNNQICLPSSDVKPQLKNPRSLSDEEWLFVFGFDTGVYKISTCYHDDDEINEKYVVRKDATGWGDRTIISFVFPYDDITGGFLGKLEKFPVTQQILNRMYSLQTCTNAEELIAANLAEEIVG